MAPYSDTPNLFADKTTIKNNILITSMCLPDLYLVFIGRVVMSTPDQVLVIRP